MFLRSVRDERGARTRIDDIIDSGVRDIISGTNLEEIVRSHDWKVVADDIQEADMVRSDVNLGKPKKGRAQLRSEEHTSELQSLMRISYAVFCLKKKKRLNPA